MKTPHPWEHIIKAYAEDTSVKIEGQGEHWQNWASVSIQQVLGNTHDRFRIKPAMRSITLANGTVVEWPEPMRVAPRDCSNVFVVHSNGIRVCAWTEDNLGLVQLFKAGFCHLTEEAAQQHRKAFVLANGGEL